MPKKIIIYENGGPEVLKYVDYSLTSGQPKENEIRIKRNDSKMNGGV